MKVSLSNMEWKLMNQLWDHAPMTLMQLTRALEEDTGWTKHTIITMLTRLEGKEAVRWEQVGRTRHYSPVIAREDARREETASFLDRVYGGKLGLMMSALVDDHALTKEDIDELSEILRKAGEEK